MSENNVVRRKARLTRYMNIKLIVFFLLVVAMLIFLSYRIFMIVYSSGDKYTKQVLNQQQYSSTTIPYKRGDIVDRNGVVLATSIKVYNLILDPKIILSEDGKYYDATIDALCSVFGYSEGELIEYINDRATKSYAIKEKNLEYQDIKPFLDIQNDTKNYPYVKGVWFEEQYMRKYPFSTLASNVIGFTGYGNVGNWGIEGSYSDILNGTNGRKYGYVDENNNMESVIKEAVDGNTVVSTIDFNVQTIVEKYIAQWKEQYTPENIGVVIVDPNTNEVIAMSGDVSYDLNNPRDLTGLYTEEEIEAMTDEETLAALNAMWRNYCISDTYEPGSTFKPFTVLSALEEKIVSTEDTFSCDGKEIIGEWTIKCHKNEGHGKLTLAETVALSCNDAMMYITDKMGTKMFAEYQSRFNFGKLTGIDLPGEESCVNLIYSAENMGASTLATNSFGQNFNVTMIQMISAFASAINGGYYYEPHVVTEILNPAGGVSETIGTTLVKRTTTEANSEIIRQACYMCVESGSGRSARIDGYKIGGKTGTAQKLPREDEKYLVSFMGFVSNSSDEPQLLGYVVVDNPVMETVSSSAASKLWKAIMEEVLPYMNIFPETGDLPDDNNPDVNPDEEPENTEDFDEVYEDAPIEDELN
ncbi:MAG: penicillin-binding protein 2 [Lachnospiraceae bacterium]|nr:penicillin-binding protein 2 [Lachnospiraceae bacterium]